MRGLLRYIKYSLLLPLLFGAANAAARDFKDFYVRYFGDESLPQSIGDLAVGRSGFLWVATQMGLVRFDGHHFKLFTPENTPQLKNVRSLYFHADRNGTLYYEDGSFNLYRLEQTGPGKLPISRDTINIQHGRLYVIGKSLPFDDPLRAKGDYAVSFTRVRSSTTITYRYAFHNDTVKQAIPLTPETYDPSFMVNGRLYIMDDQFQVTALYPGTAAQKIPVTGDLLRNPLFGAKNAAYSARKFEQQEGIFYLLGSSIYRLQVVHDTLHTTEVVGNTDIKDITAFYADSANGYYAVGTLAKGLYLLYPKNFSVRRLRAGDDASIFYAVQPVRDNLFLSGKGYLFDLYKDEEQPIGKEMCPWGLFRQQSHIWCSSLGYFHRVDTHTLTEQRYLPDRRWLIQGQTDPWNRTWLLTLTSLGLLEQDHIDWFIQGTSMPPDRGKNFESILVKDRNTLWIGCRDGLSTLDIPSRTMTDIPEMKGKYVRNLIADDRGGVWVLTYGNGYYYYRDGMFTTMPLDRNNNLGNVHTMLEDRNGFYWMPTNKGLFRAGKQALYRYINDKSALIRYEYFDKQSGFLTNEFNGGCHPCGYAVSDTLMLLPSMNGLVYFNPLHINTPPLTNPIYIDKVQIDDKEQNIASAFSVPADFSTFRCEIASPYYGIEENMVLEYKIDGIMKHWMLLADNRYLQFNRLPHGTYTIRIRKVVNFETGATSELTFRFNVLVPWYLEIWFILTCGGIAIFLVWLLVRLRLRLLTRQKQKLEQQIQERTNQLADSLVQLKSTVESLEQSQADLYRSNRFREQLTSIVLHDIQTPLRFLKRVVKQVQQTHRDMPPERLNTELEDLYFSTAEVAAYSEDFLTWIKSQRDTFEITYRQVALYPLLEEIGNLYHKIAANTGAVIQISCPEGIQLRTDPALLSIIIRNLVDNAVKYSPHKGRVVLTGMQQPGVVIVSVRDNGKGMSGEQVKQLLNEADSQTVTASGKLGYQFIKDLTRILGGNLKIVSKPGGGTTVSLHFTIR